MQTCLGYIPRVYTSVEGYSGIMKTLRPIATKSVDHQYTPVHLAFQSILFFLAKRKWIAEAEREEEKLHTLGILKTALHLHKYKKQDFILKNKIINNQNLNVGTQSL